MADTGDIGGASSAVIYLYFDWVNPTLLRFIQPSLLPIGKRGFQCCIFPYRDLLVLLRFAFGALPLFCLHFWHSQHFWIFKTLPC